MTLNCIHIFIITGSFLYWCVMRPASQRFFIHSCFYLRILIISYLATFLGTNSLSVMMCRKAVNQSIWSYLECMRLWQWITENGRRLSPIWTPTWMKEVWTKKMKMMMVDMMSDWQPGQILCNDDILVHSVRPTAHLRTKLISITEHLSPIWL